MTDHEQDELQQAEIRAGIVKKAPKGVSSSKAERKEFMWSTPDDNEWFISVIRKGPESPWVFGPVCDHHHRAIGTKKAEAILEAVRAWGEPEYCAVYAN